MRILGDKAKREIYPLLYSLIQQKVIERKSLTLYAFKIQYHTLDGTCNNFIMENIMSSVILSVRMDSSIKSLLEEEAKKEDRSASYLALEAIKKYLSYKEEKRQAILQAVEEADKGVFVSKEAVHKWADSWGTDNELPVPEPDIFLDEIK